MRTNPWFRLGLNAWALGMEASAVIALRSLKILSKGATGKAEAQRMINEKIQAALALQAKALTGGLGLTPRAVAPKTVAHYRRKVRANRRRLTKG